MLKQGSANEELLKTLFPVTEWALALPQKISYGWTKMCAVLLPKHLKAAADVCRPLSL